MNNGRGRLLRCLLLSFVLLSTAASAASSDIRDVPPGHWAYDAVRTLVGRGYLSLGADGAFNGNEPVDRYTLASVLAQMLEEFDAAPGRATATDVQLLRKLTDEYRAELVTYYAAQQKLSRSVDAADKRFSTLDEKINEALVAFGDLSSRTDALQRQVAENATLSASLGSQTKDLRREVDSVGQHILTIDKDLSTRLRQVEGETSSLKAQDADLVAQLNAIRSEAIRQDQKRETLEKQNAAELAKLDQLADQLLRLEQQAAQQDGQMKKQANDLQRELAAQKKSLEAETTARTQELDALGEKIENLQLGLEGKLGTNFASQDRKLDTSVAELRRELAAQQERLETETNTRTRALEAHEARIRQLQSDLDSQDRDLRNQIAAEGALQDSKMQKQAIDLRQELAAQKKSLEEETTAHTQALDALEKRIAQLQSDLDGQSRTQVLAMQSALDVHDKELRNQIGREAALQDSKMQKQVTDLRQELAVHKEDLEAESTAHLRALEAHEARIRQLQSDLNSQDSDLRNQIATEAALQDSRMQKQVTDLRQELAAQKKSFEEETTAHTQALSTVEQRITRLQSDLDSQSKAQVLAMQSALDVHDKELRNQISREAALQDSKMQKQVTDLRQELAVHKEDQEAESIAHLRALEAHEARIQQLQSDLDSQDRDLRSQIGTEAALRDSKIQELEERITASQSEIEAQNLALESRLIMNVAAQDRRMEQHVTDLKQELAAQGKGLEDEAAVRVLALRRLEEQLATAMSDCQARNLELESILSVSLAAQDRKREEYASELRQELSGQKASFEADMAAYRSTLETVQTQITILESDLAAQDRDLRDTLSNEIASQNKRLDAQIANLRRELVIQKEDLTSEATARAAAIQSLEQQIATLQSDLSAQDQRLALVQEEMVAKDQVLAQRLEAAQAQHEAELAVLRKQNEEQVNQFQQALAALAAGLQGQMDGLKTELARTQRELDQANAKLLAAESRLGLSDDQLAELQRFIEEGLAEHLTASLARERAMEKKLSDLELRHEASQVKIDQDIKETSRWAWGAAALSALLGIFVTP